jgi:2-iminobutanoate/2-iminopropanoate deaminase
LRSTQIRTNRSGSLRVIGWAISFSSRGQAAIDGTGQIVGSGDFDAQAEQVFENLERVLRAGGSSLKNVIKVTIFLRDMSNFDKVVKLRGRYFTAPYPADTIVEISSLYSPDALIEIEAVAIADDAAERT